MSVIIAAFNVSQYVQEAVDSVLYQRFPKVEIIVVNDGSTDTEELERVLATYQEKIVYLKQANLGVSEARNTGIRVARGKWLAFLDADDIWLPNYLNRQVAVLSADSTIDMVFPDGIFFGCTELAGRRTMEVSPAEGEITFLRALRGDVTIAYCGLIRRELVLQVGMFDPGLRASEDYNLWLRILRAGGRIVALREPLYKYRRRDESLTADVRWMTERILEAFRRIEETMHLTEEEHAALKAHRKKLNAGLSWWLARKALMNLDRSDAVRHFTELLRYSPTLKNLVTLAFVKLLPSRVSRVVARELRGARLLQALH